MNISDLLKTRVLMQPNIKYDVTQYQYALAGHLFALAGAAVAIIFGLFEIFSVELFSWVSGMLAAGFVLLIELDIIKLPPLRDPLVRGIVWLIIAILASTFGLVAALLTLVSSIIYIVIYYN